MLFTVFTQKIVTKIAACFHNCKVDGSNLHWKGLMAPGPSASLAFRWTLTYDIPSVFHADQRGMEDFLDFGL